jgi:integrase/recombinase XerD
MRSALTEIARMLGVDFESFDWAALDYQHTRAIRRMLIERGLAPATVNKYLAALRGVLKEAFRLGYMSPDQYARAADLEGVRGERELRGRMLKMGEIAAILETCSDGTAIGTRDAAIIALMVGCGLRRAELVALDLQDIVDRAPLALRVRNGKGNNERTVYATNGAERAVSAWLEVRGDDPGPLFWPSDHGRLVRRRMTADAVYLMLRKRADQAGVERFGPHDLRRTFVSTLLELGADIATVQRLAGHKQVTTTARYDRRGEDAKIRAAEMLHIPFRQVAERNTHGEVEESGERTHQTDR